MYVVWRAIFFLNPMKGWQKPLAEEGKKRGVPLTSPNNITAFKWTRTVDCVDLSKCNFCLVLLKSYRYMKTYPYFLLLSRAVDDSLKLSVFLFGCCCCFWHTVFPFHLLRWLCSYIRCSLTLSLTGFLSRAFIACLSACWEILEKQPRSNALSVRDLRCTCNEKDNGSDRSETLRTLAPWGDLRNHSAYATWPS